MKSTTSFRPESKEQSESAKLPYRAQKRLITPSELRFLHTGLQPAVGDRFFIAVQVPLTSIITVDEELWNKSAGRKIRQKRIDFVLAYPKTFRIAAAIELDDLSHAEEHRRRRDRFVNAAMEAAGIPLVRISVYRKYDDTIIRRIINRALRMQRETKCE